MLCLEAIQTVEFQYLQGEKTIFEHIVVSVWLVLFLLVPWVPVASAMYFLFFSQ